MDKLLASFDKQIRAGQGQSVRKALLEIPKKKIPRAQLALYAWLAWRVGAAEQGVAWLNSVVRPKARSPQPPSPREKAEYAACLTRLGAVGEALDLLKTVSPKQVPQAALYQVFALVAQWRYNETIPLLKEYIQLAPSEYDVQIAEVNLAAALIFHKEYERALALLEKLAKQTEAAGNQLLSGNVQELRASVFIHMGNWKAALKECEGAKARLRSHGGVFSLLIDKWGALATLGLSPDSKASLKAVAEVKKKAAALGHWESIRDCDRFEAIIRRATPLLEEVFFGTPNSDFRERLLADFSPKVTLPDSYERVLGKGLKGKEVSLDLRKWVGEMKPGRQNHRALSVLASDFYRPFRSAQLHALLFPGEYYNPHSSRHRTAAAIHRLKVWLRKEFPALTVSRGTRGYALEAKVPVRLRVRLEITEYREPELERLRAAHGTGLFSLSDAMDVLGLARRTMSRQLGEWAEEGWLRRSGAGPGCRYEFIIDQERESEAEKAAR